MSSVIATRDGSEVGTVQSVSVVTANGVSGSVANPTTTPAITLTLGAITPTTVNGNTITTGTGTLTLGTGSTLATSATNSITLTSTGATNVTLPTTGTLATLAGTEALTNKTVNGLTITSSTGTLTIAAAKTLMASNTLTFTGTDGSSVAFGAGGTVLYGNQTVTLSGDVTGSGATAITTTVAAIAGTTVSGTTGTTNVVFSTSPTLATSLLTGSATFSLLNTTATTVNFAGAATTLNIGASATCILNFGGSTTASELRFLEPSGSGTNYTAIKVGAQAANITYTLPAAVGAAGTFLKDAAGDGVLSWAAAGVSWGSSASGTTADGLTLTLSNSSDDGASALVLTAGNTQASQPCLANLQIGTSGKPMGIMIKGKGSDIVGAVGTGQNHLALWCNLDAAGSADPHVLVVADGTTFNETAFIRGDGSMKIQATAATGGCFNTSLEITTTAANRSILTLTGNVPVGWVSYSLIDSYISTATGTLSDRTTHAYRFGHLRASNRTSGTTTDAYDTAIIYRSSIQSGAGGTFTVSGNALTVQNYATKTAGTENDSSNVLGLVQDSTSTGKILTLGVSVAGGAATEKAAFTVDGNFLLGVAAAGTSAANGVMALGNGATAPSDSADMVQLYAFDISAGNASLGIRTETAVVSETVVSDRTLTVKINGTNYKICLKV